MTSRDQILTISKLDAARDQLDAALQLYFDDSNPVAVHSLTAAAHGILRDLCSDSGEQMLTERWLLKGVGRELTSELIKKMRAAQNFFKHADRDSGSTLKFSPAATDLLLLDCVVQYPELTGAQTILQEAFEKWFVLLHPQTESCQADRKSGEGGLLSVSVSVA